MEQLKVNYWIRDIFNQEYFVNTEAYLFNEERDLRTAFKAILKHDACVFIFYNNKNAVRYSLKDHTANDNILLETPLEYINGTQNEEETILIDYNTALKQELKLLKSETKE